MTAAAAPANSARDIRFMRDLMNALTTGHADASPSRIAVRVVLARILHNKPEILLSTAGMAAIVAAIHGEHDDHRVHLRDEALPTIPFPAIPRQKDRSS